MAENVIRIPPNQYVHVLDNNKITTRLETGPQTFIRREHEQIVEGPTPMLNLPPRTYCKILNPVLRDNNGKPITNEIGEIEVQQGEFEIRTAEQFSDPFPLYPGEKLSGKVESLIIVAQNTLLRLIAIRDFVDNGVQRLAGEEWQRAGPFTYVPKIEEQIVKLINATVIKANTALRLRTIRAFKDRNGINRKAGEEWLVRKQGSYLPDTWEQIVEVVKGYVLSDNVCLHLRAISEFKDFYGVNRLAGQEWLITNKQAQVHIKDVFEEIVGVENAITLSSRQYAIIFNPLDKQTQNNEWGRRLLVKGERTFFLQPGEQLESGKQNVEILSEEEALLLKATQNFKDSDDNIFRRAGESWIKRGPCEYIPPVEVTIVERRRAIPLDSNEGIYVRDMRTGEVKEIKGKTVLLEAHEKLWEKHLPDDVEQLVRRAQSGTPYIPPKVNSSGQLVYEEPRYDGPGRDKTRIISFRATHNSAIQLYDFKLKKQRVVFGPDLVMLGPDEQFSVLKLSGGKPKRENVIQTLQLSMGPDFMTDQIIVETSDHAKLALTLSYNWHFEVDKDDQEDAKKLFAVKDFVGDTCKSIGARVRGAVSAVTFEDFHHNSSLKIKEAVFGRDKETGQLKTHLKFDANNLVVTSVDIQGQEITDETTRKQLAQSINQAIEISSKSQEMTSKHQAEKLSQEAQGQLLRQKLEDQAKAEATKIKLLEQQAESARVKAEGDAVAQAYAESIQTKIRGEAEVNQVKLRVQALQIEEESQLESQRIEQKVQIDHTRAVYELEVKKARELSEIEVKKFKQIVQAIGTETLIAMAKAGPETKAKLLQGLGLKGYLVTDGKSPINLFNTANGFIGEKQ